MNNAEKRTSASRAVAVALAASAVAAFPGQAFASSGSLLTDVSGFFENLQGLALVIYYGILTIAGVITFISVGKELLPAMVKTNKEQKQDFKGHVAAAAVAVLVLAMLALAPVIVPAAVSYFGGTADVGLSAIGI